MLLGKEPSKFEVYNDIEREFIVGLIEQALDAYEAANTIGE